MKCIIRFQRGICLPLILFGLALWSGCRSDLERINQRLGQISDPRLSSVLRKNINAGGRVATWLQTQKIEAQALTTIHDLDGGKSLLEQRHELLPGQPISLRLISRTPEGPWIEHIDAEEQVSMFLEDQQKQLSLKGAILRWLKSPNIFKAKEPDIADPEVLQGAGLKLRLISQALTQSFGLLRDDWSLSYAGQERKGGRLSHKLIVNGMMLYREVSEDLLDVGDQLVIWIDAETFLVDRMWLRYCVQPGSGRESFVYLAANMKNYQKQPNGLVLPTYIGFVHSDQHQQFSESEILRIEYLKIQAVKKPRKKGLFQ